MLFNCIVSERPVPVLSVGSSAAAAFFSVFTLRHWFSVQFKAEEVFFCLIDNQFGVSCSCVYCFPNTAVAKCMWTHFCVTFVQSFCIFVCYIYY